MLASLAMLAAVGSSFPAAAPAPVDVAYDGFLILRVRSAAWGLSPEKRGVHLTRRFTDLVSDSFLAIAREHPVPHPHIKHVGKDWVVVARGAVLVTATPDDGHLNHCDCEMLAKQWCRRYDGALHVALTGVKPSLGEARLQRPSLLARALRPIEWLLHVGAEPAGSQGLLTTPPSEKPREAAPLRKLSEDLRASR
jgi:hypothetical protein